MRRILSLSSLCVAVVLTCGCGGPAVKTPPDVPVKGTVNLDGKALPEGEVVFSVTGFPPGTMAVKDGAFSGTAKEGMNKVEIRSFKNGPPLATDPDKKPTKINILPARYSDQSKESADVKVGGANEFKFDVSSK